MQIATFPVQAGRTGNGGLTRFGGLAIKANPLYRVKFAKLFFVL
jgi:hypothetical protein